MPKKFNSGGDFIFYSDILWNPPSKNDKEILLQMKTKKIYIASLIILTIWIFLPSSLFINEKNKVFDIISPDKKYKVKIYRTEIISPFSFYKYLKDENYYFVLSDINGDVIFKPSPFYGTSEIAAYDSIEFMYGTDKELLYPGKLGYDGYILK